MKKVIILAIAIALGAFGAYMVYQEAERLKAEQSEDYTSDNPAWLEADSAAAIKARTIADFSLSRDEILAAIRDRHPDVTDNMLDTFINRHFIEAMMIDGRQMFHRKSPGNLDLLNPQYADNNTSGDKAAQNRYAYVDSVLEYYRGKNYLGLSHLVKYRFSIDVPYNEAIKGDTLKVWMPVPLANPEGGRQRDFKIISATPSDYILSGNKSVHNTIFFSAPAPQQNDTAHFEYEGEYIVSGAYFPPQKIIEAIKPYDKNSDLYNRYTKFESPHIINLDSIARSIVGEESNPFRQSELVYDWIDANFPWAGAREYSTIPCIPEYVLTERHGDCGQVSLLYISLMRSLGIPARWESGWMLHPGETNLHDWAEVYFEGIGWVPVDVSFGRYKGADDPEITDFYSHGIDAHRFATNTGVCGDLFPPKKFVRSETVDFQLGEVETNRGNLFYPAWDCNFEIISITPLAESK